jgi:glycosyltransferase involved in cell wall biosynthesis
MKIAIEAAPLLVQRKTGVEYFTYRLTKALVELDKTNEYQLVYMAIAGRPKPDLGISGSNVRERRIWWFPGKAYNLTLRLPVGLGIDLLAGIRPDIFFFPNFVRWPLMWTRRSVVAVHDLAYADFPEVLPNLRHRLFLSWVVPRSIKKATLVAAMSEYTKQRIVEHYGTDPDKVVVVEPSIDHEVYRPASEAEVAAVREKYGVRKPYLLYLGTLEPRKNIRRIVGGYLGLPRELQERFQLVMAGGKGWKESDVYELVQQAGEDKILLPGYIDQADVAALYSGAAAFVYPSVYEGWGMQVLEAMACGTPVITAGNSSLPEAGGDAALYVDATSTAEITAAMQAVLTDEAKAADMRAKGLRHAAQFSWQRSAQKLLEAFERLR